MSPHNNTIPIAAGNATNPNPHAHADTGLERGRGPGRRLSPFSQAAEAGEHTDEQFLFVRAMDAFKKANGVSFPSWTDVIEVVRLLGYRKVRPSELVLQGVQDWRERPDAEAGVRPDGWERRFKGPTLQHAPRETDFDTDQVLKLDLDQLADNGTDTRHHPKARETRNAA